MVLPMVETVCTIPLIIERASGFPLEAETGIPFECDTNNPTGDDSSFRSHLDDIAKRHPEFAEHLVSFPTSSTSRQNRSSNNPRDDPDLRARFQRNLPGHSRDIGGTGSRFERFGFPFDREDFFADPQQYYQKSEPQYYQQPEPQQYHQQTPQQQYHQSEPQQYYQQPQQQQPEPELNQDRAKNLQQSNTVDLGQKQEPIDVNERNQRSMSAPPQSTDNNNKQQRFVSSINIPINNKMDNENQQSNSKPTERVIPIHVEGRDEPVLPRNQHFTTTNQQQPQNEKMFSGGFTHQQQPPQPERIFGHRPSQFTQFVPPRHEDVFRQQPKPQQQQPKPEPQPMQEPEPQQPKPSTNPIDVIKLIQKDVSGLMAQVEQFDGKKRDKQYLYLDEMLTRNLIKLDNIDTQGQENIRQARKEAIKCIESCIGILESKATQQQQPEQDKMEQQQQPIPLPPSDVELLKMEVESSQVPEDDVVVEMKQEPETSEKIEVDVTENKVEEEGVKKENEIKPEIEVVEEEGKSEENKEDTSDKIEKKKVKRKFFKKSKD